MIGPSGDLKMRSARIAIALFALVGAACAATQWNRADGLDCAQIKVNGKSFSNANVTVYGTPSDPKECCDESRVVKRTKTSDFGSFSAGKLERGHYFVVFEKKGKRIIVPVEITYGSGGYCPNEEHRTAVVSVNEKTGEIRLQNFAIVD